MAPSTEAFPRKKCFQLLPHHAGGGDALRHGADVSAAGTGNRPGKGAGTAGSHDAAGIHGQSIVYSVVCVLYLCGESRHTRYVFIYNRTEDKSDETEWIGKADLWSAAGGGNALRTASCRGG